MNKYQVSYFRTQYLYHYLEAEDASDARDKASFLDDHEGKITKEGHWIFDSAIRVEELDELPESKEKTP